MKQIALIELMPYHSETLYAQLQFLRSRAYSPVLICNERLQGIVDSFKPDDTPAFYFSTHSIKDLWIIRRFLIKQDFDTVILNTAQGSAPLKFMLLPLRRKTKIVGTIHETRKLVQSKGQKLISSRIDGYYVLAEYVDRHFPLDEIKHTWFSPSFYPPYPEVDVSAEKGDNMWITIPGAIERKRRDYDSLLALARHPQLPSNVRFVLLGNARLGEGAEFIEHIQQAEAADKFIWFDGRVPNAEFYSYIQSSDYLIPLIHPGSRAAEEYCHSKISGMFPLSAAFGVKLLCHKMFEGISGFDYPALFYSDQDSLVSLISTAKPEHDANNAIDFHTEAQRYVSLFE